MKGIRLKKSMGTLCIALALFLTVLSAPVPGTLADPDANVQVTGCISGFLWADGNGMPPTGWDGLFNGSEAPVPGYTVSLYAAGSLATTVAATQTDANGEYSFEGLASGSYVLGVASAVIGGCEYLLPMSVAGQNKFATDWGSAPLMAYTSPIALAAGQHVKNIDAGVRLPMGFVPLDIASDIENTAVGGTVSSGLNGTWLVLKHQIVDGYKCTLLLRKGAFWQYPSYVFNPAGGGNNYEGSAIQTAITNEAYSYFSALYAIAVVPTLGTHTDYNAQSVPKAQMAKAAGIKKDVFFLLSRGDVYAINGNKESPLAAPFSSTHFSQSVMLRTAVKDSTANVCEIVPGANQIGYGMIINPSNAIITPAVWVRTGVVSYKVTVHYINNASGTDIASPTTHTVNHGSNFSLSPAPTVSGYDYLHWKEGSSGSTTTNPIQLTNVTQNRDIFLVYSPSSTGPERYLVSKDSNPDVILSTHHWLADAVNACVANDGAYTITATEDDLDMADRDGLSPTKKPIGANKNIAVTIPSTKTITLKSDSKATHTITMRSPAKHLDVQGELTLENIVLDGDGTAGGIASTGVLTMNNGAVIQNCKGTGYGGGANVTGGTFTMNDGSLIKDSIAQSGTTNGGGGGVYLTNATFNMTGGTISGNIGHTGIVTSGQYATGGGVYVGNGGTFNMSGSAEISGNKAGTASGANGGGVYVTGTGKFNMADGTISDNIASTVSYGPGGGVSVLSGGTFNMSGGIITCNKVAINAAGSTGNGGGVNVASGSTFEMSGAAEISYNTGSVNGPGNGGGVYVDNSTFTMEGTASIHNNVASEKGKGQGGGIYLTGTAKFTAEDTAQITDNTALKGDGGGIFSEDYDYKSDPVSASKYSPIQSIGTGVVFNGNKAGDRYRPPNSATGTMLFPINLLNNDDINYHHSSGPIPPTTALTITKTVEGPYGDRTKTFPFTLFFEDSAGKPLTAGTAFDCTGDINDTLTLDDEGKVIIGLAHGQSVTIEEIPTNASVRIIEQEDGNYSVSFEDSRDNEDLGNVGMWDMTSDHLTVNFINTREWVPETGIRLDSAWVILLPALLSVAAVLICLTAKGFFRHRRQRAR